MAFTGVVCPVLLGFWLNEGPYFTPGCQCKFTCTHHFCCTSSPAKARQALENTEVIPGRSYYFPCARRAPEDSVMIITFKGVFTQEQPLRQELDMPSPMLPYFQFPRRCYSHFVHLKTEGQRCVWFTQLVPLPHLWAPALGDTAPVGPAWHSPTQS